MTRANRLRGLHFITDSSLRKKIENAIETTSFLYLKRHEAGVSPGYAVEIGRMEILYAASIIEATLLFLFKKKGYSMSKPDYKEVHELPKTYQSDPNAVVVVAKRVQAERQDRELMLDNLLDYFSKKGVVNKRLKKKIDSARKVRNTFHLSKARNGIKCGPTSIDVAYDAVIETFSAARLHLK